MRAAQVDLGEDVLIAKNGAVRIDIDHRAVDLEQRDHLGDMRLDDESVGLARRLVDIGALGRRPVMLEIVPFALEDEAVDGLGMAMTRQHAGFPDAQQVHPVAAARRQAERAEPDILLLRHPEALVLGDGVRHHQLGKSLLRLRMAVGDARRGGILRQPGAVGRWLAGLSIHAVPPHIAA